MHWNWNSKTYTTEISHTLLGSRYDTSIMLGVKFTRKNIEKNRDSDVEFEHWKKQGVKSSE